jgi:hypothetical protein
MIAESLLYRLGGKAQLPQACHKTKPCSVNQDNRFSGNTFCRKPSPTRPYGLGPPSPAVQERAFNL